MNSMNVSAANTTPCWPASSVARSTSLDFDHLFKRRSRSAWLNAEGLSMTTSMEAQITGSDQRQLVMDTFRRRRHDDRANHRE